MKKRELENIVAGEKIQKKTLVKSKKHWIIKSLLFSTVLGGALLLTDTQASADTIDGVWVARTSEEIKAEINGNEYLIKWGDTLSAISEATNISVERLAEINKIENIDLIYAGNKLLFGGEINAKTGEDNRVVVVQGQDGKTKVVINADDNKPVVNQKETDKAKDMEKNGGSYTPPKSNEQNTDNPALPQVPEKPVEPEKPTPEEPVQPEVPVEPEKPEPEKPVEPETPVPSEVDKTGLANLYNSVTGLISTEYKANSWNNFKSVRNEAQVLLQNAEATQAEVDAMIDKLQGAISGLIKVEQPDPVNKNALSELYNSVISLVSTDYTTDSWNAFKAVREQAKAVIQDAEATQAEVDSMAYSLQQAIDALIVAELPVQVDKTKLQALVNEVKGYNAGDYTSETWEPFYQAFSKAVEILSNENATQTDVDDAKTTLENAKSKLEKYVAVNKESLIALYNSTSEYDPATYTDSSWNTFILVKADAKTIIDDKNATQKQVDDIRQKLQQAISQLEEKQESSDLSKLPEKTPTYSASMSAKFEEAVNAYRQSKGVPALPINQTSRDTSKQEAEANTSTNYMEWRAIHGASGIATTFGLTGSVTEDQAVAEAMDNFISSPGHNENLLETDTDFASDFGGGVYVMKTTVNGSVIYSFVFNGTFGW